MLAENVAFTFPLDPSVDSDNVPIFIIVEQLHISKVMPNDFRQCLAIKLLNVLVDYLRKWRKTPVRVHVLIRRYDQQEDAYSTCHR